jgi:hypothetical protein
MNVYNYQQSFAGLESRTQLVNFLQNGPIGTNRERLAEKLGPRFHTCCHAIAKVCCATWLQLQRHLLANIDLLYQQPACPNLPGDGSYQDLFAPRNFRGNLVTLSVRFAF